MQEIPENFFEVDIDSVDESEFRDMHPADRAFAVRYVSNGYNHREAALDIGINPSLGARVKRKPIVRRYIAALQKQLYVESIVTKDVLDSMLDRLEDIAFGEEEIPIVLSDGTQIFGRKFNPSLIMEVYKERAKLHDISKENEGDKVIHIEVV